MAARIRLSTRSSRYELPARRPDGEPQGKLALPRRSAGNQQVRDVGADDQQHAGGDGHQDQQRLGDALPQPRVSVSRGRDVERTSEKILPRIRRGGSEFRIGGLLIEQRPIERQQPGLGLNGRDLRPQPAKRLHPSETPAVQLQPGRPDLRLHLDRQVDRGRPGNVDAVEARAHHADDFVGMPVHRQRAADHAGIAMEPRLPVAVAKDHNRARSRVVFGSEQPADRWRHPEHGEIRARGHLADDAVVTGGTADLERDGEAAEHAGKDVIVIAEILVHRVQTVPSRRPSRRRATQSLRRPPAPAATGDPPEGYAGRT